MKFADTKFVVEFRNETLGKQLLTTRSDINVSQQMFGENTF